MSIDNNLLDKLTQFNFNNYDECQSCNFYQLNVGDFIKSQTMTNSQKYFCKPGYEQYNMTKCGILLEKNNDNPENSVILCYNGEYESFYRTNLYSDPGTSGCFCLYKMDH
jgi:hypothetical protein